MTFAFVYFCTCKPHGWPVGAGVHGSLGARGVAGCGCVGLLVRAGALCVVGLSCCVWGPRGVGGWLPVGGLAGVLALVLGSLCAGFGFPQPCDDQEFVVRLVRFCKGIILIHV